MWKGKATFFTKNMEEVKRKKQTYFFHFPSNYLE